MGIDDYAAWRGRRESGKQSQAAEQRPAVRDAPPPRTTADDGISLDFEQQAASTTIVDQVRAGLLKLLRRE